MTAPFEIDCAVVGAGVVGLAVARQLAMAGRDVFIFDKAKQIGTGTSSRNSEVIHAGIYYPTGSLKARSCVRGRELLYAHLGERQLPFKQCGKLIVAATDSELPQLESLKAQASKNGVEDIEHFATDQLRAIEPELSAKGALYSPSTGILDSHAYMVSLLKEAEDHGASFVPLTHIEQGEVRGDGRVHLRCGGAETFDLIANCFVNCAGLNATDLAMKIAGFPPEYAPITHFAKGHYFSLSRRAPFSHLIYPIPEAAGLGIHFTLDLAGRGRFGPDVVWSDVISYEFESSRRSRFVEAIRKYWPAIESDVLHADYVGVRPKLSGPDEPNSDFRICGPSDHGVTGQVHLFGIESPGLTASLALAELVEECLRD